MNIVQRLNEVKKLVAYIRKDKKVESYMAVTHDAVTAETRDHFISQGVLIVPSELSSEMKETGTATGKGAPWMRFEAKYRVSFVNVDEPTEIVSVELTAHALDYGDKAPGKAHSYAIKYAVLKILQLETGEEEEGRDTDRKKVVETTGKGIISASTGTWEMLTVDQQTQVMDVVKCVELEFAEKGATAADKLWQEEITEWETEAKVAGWAKFESPQRAAMKKSRHEAKREAQISALTAVPLSSQA